MKHTLSVDVCSYRKEHEYSTLPGERTTLASISQFFASSAGTFSWATKAVGDSGCDAMPGTTAQEPRKCLRKVLGGDESKFLSNVVAILAILPS